MSPFTDSGQRMLFQDVVSLAPAIHAGPRFKDSSLECPNDQHAGEHAPCHEGTVTERFSGPELRLEEVQQRFRAEAVLGSFDTGRYRCRYFSWGSGPPLVFIHGLGDDALSFIMPIARLSEHFRCISYDQPTGGADGAHLGRYHHADLVKDLLALVDHLGLPTAHLLGSSFGSTIALAAMHGAPGRFPRGILHSGFARRPLFPAEEMLASWARYWPWNMESLPLRLTLLTHTHYAPFKGRQPELWQYFVKRDGAIPMEAVARRALILNHVDLRPILPRIRQSVLLVCGDQDPLVGKNCEQELLRGLPSISRAEIAGCGHMAQFTHPEALAEATRRFLSAG
jgi:pimeloyl-ACP methyl ester carboxylesterase